MAESVNITFTPLRSSGSVPKGTTILNAARILGIEMEGPCNGAGNCGKDLVQIRKDGALETVLACKTVLTEDTEVIVPSHDRKGVKIVEEFFQEGRADYDINPAVRKSLHINDEGVTTTSVFIDNLLIATEEGDTTSRSYGISLDIGTTTVVASLMNLQSMKVERRASTLNPLVFYGHDVMSRIRYSASDDKALLRMHRELISSINLLIDVMISDNGFRKDDIYQVVAAGNTTMQHIFLNKDISGIGEYPYTAEVLDKYTTTAGELNINIHKDGEVMTFPCMSAYVGGDIVSGLIAIGGREDAEPTLFIDIGTNGEMVLLTERGMTATSCAAGPCFEGMNISCGMRAGTGAIESFSMKDGVSFDVIGGVKARGICGSGLLDAVSEMIRTGIINSRGRLQGEDNIEIPEIYRRMLFQKDGKRHFRISDDLSISQEDIRQVQLARAAIRTGVEFLISEGGISREGLKRVIIAGGFGYHLSRESLLTVGLIPNLPGASISFVGNSSLEGARVALGSRDAIIKAESMARRAKVIELANIDGFEKRFVREMNFS